MADPTEVAHNEAEQRFFVRLEGYEACLMYRRVGKTFDLYHTYVPQVFRGKGIAERLCQTAFEYAKAHGLSVIPSCSYISDAYLKRHPEYQSLTQHGPTSNPIVSG